MSGCTQVETDPEVPTRGGSGAGCDFVDFAVMAEDSGLTASRDGAPRDAHDVPVAAPSARRRRGADEPDRLGSAVTVLPLFSPIRVAEEAGTLDLLSGGRFELGLGRGVPARQLRPAGT